MINLSVIIPFYQKRSGLLRKAVTSILNQKFDFAMAVEIIVIDDGSPVPAKDELEGIESRDGFKTVLIEKQNGGVAAARNDGLAAVSASSDYVAFLDSDDAWYPDHLQVAIPALEEGKDLYFCATTRADHYAHSFDSEDGQVKLMNKFLASVERKPIIDVPSNLLLRMNLEDFVTHPQGSIFRRLIAQGLTFDTRFKNAGEDYLFFAQLIARSKKSCFSADVHVECGAGVNIYYSSFNWDSPTFLRRLTDELLSRIEVLKVVAMPKEDAAWLKANITSLKTQIAFHIMRKVLKDKGRWPEQVASLKREDRWFYAWFPFYCCRAIVARSKMASSAV